MSRLAAALWLEHRAAADEVVQLASQHGIETELSVPAPAVSAPHQAPWLIATRRQLVALHQLMRKAGWRSRAGSAIELALGISVRYERRGIALWLGRPRTANRGVLISSRIALPIYGVVAPLLQSGEFDFAGVRLRVWLNVFKPHPSTAQLVEAARMLCNPAPQTVLDVGTGAGGIAIGLARTWPTARVVGIDKSPRAVACARMNARRLHCPNVSFRLGDLLNEIPQASAQLIAGNVAWLAPAVYLSHGGEQREFRGPPSALLDEHADGMGHLRRLISQGASCLTPGGWILLQLSALQLAPTRSLLEQGGFRISEVAEDIIAGQLISG